MHRFDRAERPLARARSEGRANQPFPCLCQTCSRCTPRHHSRASIHKPPRHILPPCPIGPTTGHLTKSTIRNYVFEIEKDRTTTQDTARQKEPITPKTWARLVPRNYRLNYALDKVQTQLNNTFNTSFYQPYNGQVNAQPGLGNATEIRLSDVMDDKHLIGGYTVPVNLSNTFLGLHT